MKVVLLLGLFLVVMMLWCFLIFLCVMVRLMLVFLYCFLWISCWKMRNIFFRYCLLKLILLLWKVSCMYFFFVVVGVFLFNLLINLVVILIFGWYFFLMNLSELEIRFWNIWWIWLGIVLMLGRLVLLIIVLFLLICFL